MADIEKIITVAAGDIKAVFGTAKANIKKAGGGGGFAAAGASTSYDNALGSGDRTATITVTESRAAHIQGTLSKTVNGQTTGNGQWYMGGVMPGDAVPVDWLKWDLGSSKVIDEARFYQQNTTTHATYKWQGSTNDSDWTDVGGTFVLGGAGSTDASSFQTITTLNGNTTAYRYWRILGVSGQNSSGPYCFEFEFKIEA